MNTSFFDANKYVWRNIIFIFAHFRFHIITPMFTGFANVVNCLYNVKQMVYSESTVTTLEVLRMALINNWGEK